MISTEDAEHAYDRARFGILSARAALMQYAAPLPDLEVTIPDDRWEVVRVADTLAARVKSVRDELSLPMVVGFGISNSVHVAARGRFAEAAVIGSAIVSLIEKTPPEEAAAAVGRFIYKLRDGAGQSQQSGIRMAVR